LVADDHHAFLGDVGQVAKHLAILAEDSEIEN
jgi:hypothetical protein